MIIAPNRNDLDKIVILNPKGGCGKTTLATNLASYFALHGPAPTLIDNDSRGYSMRWLDKRPRNARKIHGIANYGSSGFSMRNSSLHIPGETNTVIIDTPAALGRREIDELTYDAACVLIPVVPSAFDVRAVTTFIAELLLLTEFDQPIAVVANRTRQNTKSLAMLLRILNDFETPIVAVLRDSQNFLHAANMGVGIYEMPRYSTKKDLEQMDVLTHWLDQLLAKTLDPEFVAPKDLQAQLSPIYL